MPDLDIALATDGTTGRYSVALEDGSEAEMTYRMTSPDIMAINHTFVPPKYRGGNIAEALVIRGVEDARKLGLKIDPVCPYVAVQFRRHPGWQDLLAK